MEKISAIESLKLIKSDEWKDFEKFSSSAYFNKGRNYSHLLKVLKKYHPEFSHKNLTRVFIYAKLHPGKTYNENVLKVILSGLNKLVEEFITYKEFTSSEKVKRNFLLKALIMRGSENRAKNLINEIENSFKNKPLALFDYQDKLNFAYISSSFKKNVNDDNKHQVQYITDFILNSIYSNILFTRISEIELMQNSVTKKSDKKINYMNSLVKCIDMKKVLELMKKNDPDTYDVFSVYDKIFNVLKSSEGIESYFELKTFIEKIKRKFDKELYLRFLVNLYLLIIILFNKFKKQELIKESLSILEKLFNHDYYKFIGIGEYLPVRMFMNGVVGYQLLGKIDEALLFISRYKNKISPEFQYDVINYSTGLIEYERKNYDIAIEKLMKVNTNDFTYKTDTKVYLSMIYYETNSFSSLHPLLDSFRHLIKSSELDDNYQAIRANRFINNITTLAKLKENNSHPEKVNDFKFKLIKEKYNPESWFFKKIKELENRI